MLLLRGWEPFRVSFDPEDLRIEGNPFRMNPAYGLILETPSPCIPLPRGEREI
jgi:hypothetical protein